MPDTALGTVSTKLYLTKLHLIAMLFHSIVQIKA